MAKLIALISIVLLLFLGGLGFYLYSNPSYNITGSVTSADNDQAVEGAKITIGNTSTQSDSQGKFTLAKVKGNNLTVIEGKYETYTSNIDLTKSTRSGLLNLNLTLNIKITPTVQEEAQRKWNFIKFNQIEKAWELLNPDIQKLITKDKYVSDVNKGMKPILDAGGSAGDQKINNVTDLETWKEPTTGKVYTNVKELQTTQTYNVFGASNSTNFTTHWVKSGNIWTFFAKPDDSSAE